MEGLREWKLKPNIILVCENCGESLYPCPDSCIVDEGGRIMQLIKLTRHTGVFPEVVSVKTISGWSGLNEKLSP